MIFTILRHLNLLSNLSSRKKTGEMKHQLFDENFPIQLRKRSKFREYFWIILNEFKNLTLIISLIFLYCLILLRCTKHYQLIEDITHLQSEYLRHRFHHFFRDCEEILVILRCRLWFFVDNKCIIIEQLMPLVPSIKIMNLLRDLYAIFSYSIS